MENNGDTSDLDVDLVSIFISLRIQQLMGSGSEVSVRLFFSITFHHFPLSFSFNLVDSRHPLSLVNSKKGSSEGEVTSYFVLLFISFRISGLKSPGFP
jgi:hypothetical protein